MNQHTQGEWTPTLDDNDGSESMEIISIQGATICNVYGVDDFPCLEFESDEEETAAKSQMLANANLIAAAPELLAALQVCFTALQTYGDHPIIKAQVLSAINKATNQNKR